VRIAVRNRCSDFDSYRAARVKSLFNAESGCDFSFDAERDLSGDGQIGVVVGPSGSGQTSIGRLIFGEHPPPSWSRPGRTMDNFSPNMGRKYPLAWH
jgi:ABC-type glutathione transport system ATPase component